MDLHVNFSNIISFNNVKWRSIYPSQYTDDYPTWRGLSSCTIANKMDSLLAVFILIDNSSYNILTWHFPFPSTKLQFRSTLKDGVSLQYTDGCPAWTIYKENGVSTSTNTKKTEYHFVLTNEKKVDSHLVLINW